MGDDISGGLIRLEFGMQSLFNGVFGARHSAWSCYVGANRDQKHCAALKVQEPTQLNQNFMSTQNCAAKYSKEGLLLRPSLCVVNPATPTALASSSTNS